MRSRLLVGLTLGIGALACAGLWGASEGGERGTFRARTFTPPASAGGTQDFDLEEARWLEDGVAELFANGVSTRERCVGPLPPGTYSFLATSLGGREARGAVTVVAGEPRRLVQLRLE